MTHRLPNAVSRTELGYLDGVTSAIQTQLDAKSPLSGPTFTGTVTLPSTTSIGNVSSTEIGYLDGITSAIQTQIDGKLSTGGGTLTGNLTLSSGDVIVSYSNSTWTSPSNNSVPQMEIKNSAAAATGHSNLYIHTSGASGGDPFVTMYIDGVAGWSIGADNSDSDKFKIANSWTDLGTNTRLEMLTSGQTGINTAALTSTGLVVHGPGTSSTEYGAIFRDSAGANLLLVRADTYLIVSANYYANNTSASAANMYMGAGGTIYRSTSSIKWKTDVLSSTPEEEDNVIFNLRPITYKAVVPKNDNFEDFDKSKDRRWWGFIAEEVEEIDSRLVDHDNDGNPAGLHYDRIIPALVGVIQRLEKRVSELESNQS